MALSTLKAFDRVPGHYVLIFTTEQMDEYLGFVRIKYERVLIATELAPSLKGLLGKQFDLAQAYALPKSFEYDVVMKDGSPRHFVVTKGVYTL